jgi:hypothetical protein
VKYYICMYNIMFSKIEDMERYLPFILCDCVMVMELEMSIHLKNRSYVVFPLVG